MAKAKNPKVIMTSAQFVQRVKKIASRRTFYKNKYPFNLCYINSDGRTSADCVNLYKAILNGYNVDITSAGYFQRDLSNTGDCTEIELLEQCSDVSSDFSKLKKGEPRILYMSGHIGGYIGEEVTISGKVYNVIECTVSWQGGILYSYVDGNGNRCQYKGASPRNRWAKHGKMTPWVSYSSTPAPQPTPAPKKSIDEVAKDVIAGKYGNEPERSKKLKAEGYTDAEIKQIQAKVNEMMTPKQEAQYYTVVKGDTFSGIAKKKKVSQKKLKELNPQIKDINKIYVGQKIRIK